MTPFFTIIMPCYLGEYKGAASNREEKLVRAIRSVQGQVFDSWELIVVADGCEKTMEIVRENFMDDMRIDCVKIPKQKVWSGQPRNVGKNEARGQWIVYCDADDVLGTRHLETIHYHAMLTHSDWLFFNDLLADRVKGLDLLHHRKCSIKKGRCGTSNIAFKKTLQVSWDDETYLHDWRFIERLLPMKHEVVAAGEYIVCHIPKILDV